MQPSSQQSKTNPPYQPPHHLQFLPQQFSQHNLPPKNLQQLNQTLPNQLSQINLHLLSLQPHN
ncbi:XkdW family protein, partial [Bacillus subtilis]|uniref:XkdW family protein n=1 Tax=Bacillus subtilis TaxID=1423 RepID=UPI00338FDBA0